MPTKFNDWVQSKQDRIVVICRGPSGSGKSHTAKEMLKKYGGGDPYEHIFSTDAYFIQDVIAQKRSEEGSGKDYRELEKETYRKNWSVDKLGAAHGWNMRRFEQALQRWMTPLIVDNTNTQAKEMKFYVEAAEKAGYKVIIKEPDSPWWKDHAAFFKEKQKHGTQLEDFARFLAGYHQGMEKKYGVTGNTHGVPLDTIRNMIRRYQPDLTPDDIMGRSDRFKKK